MEGFRLFLLEREAITKQLYLSELWLGKVEMRVLCSQKLAFSKLSTQRGTV